eukprot:COSAG05_NODE_1347_length_5118_cov_5.195258_4_plen_161_part_00
MPSWQIVDAAFYSESEREREEERERERERERGGGVHALVEQLEVDIQRVILRMVVGQRPIRITAHAVDPRCRRRRLGHHVIVREARHSAVVRHPGKDTGTGHDRAERHVELLRKVRGVGAARGQNPGAINLERGHLDNLARARLRGGSRADPRTVEHGLA